MTLHDHLTLPKGLANVYSPDQLTDNTDHPQRPAGWARALMITIIFSLNLAMASGPSPPTVSETRVLAKPISHMLLSALAESDKGKEEMQTSLTCPAFSFGPIGKPRWLCQASLAWLCVLHHQQLGCFCKWDVSGFGAYYFSFPILSLCCFISFF